MSPPTRSSIREVGDGLVLGEALPCGCWVGTRTVGAEHQFFMAPCSLGCEWWRYAIDESQKAGHRFEVREVS